MDSLFISNMTVKITHSSNPKTIETNKGHIFLSSHYFTKSLNSSFLPSHSKSKFTVNCQEIEGEDFPLSASSASHLLGVDRNCSLSDLKSAFRSKVKQFHPDVSKNIDNSDVMIRRVIRAYEILCKNQEFENDPNREGIDPFDEPECEALDLFVNESLCIGKGCSYSCVKTAPNTFSFDPWTGTARVTFQEYGEKNLVHKAVSQCPRSCIHYVTPSQRIILEELLDSIMNSPFDTTAEANILFSLINKAKFENNRYQQKSKKQPKSSKQNVDWF